MNIRIDNRAGFSSDHLAAVSEGLERMSCPASAEVVICDDFVNVVRDLLSSATYDTARGANVVAAKTIAVSDDRQVIVVNAEPAGGLDLAELARLLAHEAGHALIHSRGEGHPNLDLRASQIGEQVLYALATTALDEFRVERAVYAQGFPLAQEVDWRAAGESATEVNLAVMEAVIAPHRNRSDVNEVEQLAVDIAAVHDWSSKKMAYIAAAVAAGLVPENVDVPTDHQADWADYLEDTWPYRLAAYRQAPDASSPASADQLRRIVDKLMTVERHYLKSMGFFYREERDLWGFHRRRDDSLFDARLGRASVVALERERADSE